MRFTSVALGRVAPFAALAACVALGTAPAVAKGTVTIQQSDGSTNVYNNSVIKIIHNALYVTSPDGDGTLVINRAACSYQGELLVCFPTSGALVQSGATKAIDLKTGTIYVNSTDDAQPMAMTTNKVAPHSITISFSTYKGTYVSVVGRIDKVVK